MPQVKCKICNKEFYVKPSHQKLGYGKYCSLDCRYKSMRKGKFVICEICNEETWKTPKALKRSKSGKFFCNKHCQAIWRNKTFSGSSHPNWTGGQYIYRKLMKGSKEKCICSSCRIDNKKVLVVHHKDCNRNNNNISNLIWLCRNCHYLIHNGKTI